MGMRSDRGGGNSGKDSKTVFVYSKEAGRIIGKGGETVKEIMQRTGTDVQVERAGPGDNPNAEREIKVFGSKAGIDEAIQMIMRDVSWCRSDSDGVIKSSDMPGNHMMGGKGGCFGGPPGGPPMGGPPFHGMPPPGMHPVMPGMHPGMPPPGMHPGMGPPGGMPFGGPPGGPMPGMGPPGGDMGSARRRSRSRSSSSSSSSGKKNTRRRKSKLSSELEGSFEAPWMLDKTIDEDEL